MREYYLKWMLIAALCFGLYCTINNAKAATDAIGVVSVQEGVTSVVREEEESDLTKDNDIMFMDNIKTGKGEIGITFIDDTVVAVSSQSSLIIDDFVYDANNASGSKLALKVAAGTVRYASGNIAKLNRQNVDIRTPTAKIAVRGTAFSMTVDEIGQSLIILLPNVDGTVGEIAVESDVGIVILKSAFEATSVRSSESKPSKPKVLDLTANMINNMLIIKPPKEKVTETIKKDIKKKNNILSNLLDGESELDKNLLDEKEDEGFTSLDVNPLDIALLLNILEQLNKRYEKMNILTEQRKVARETGEHRDGQTPGYNEDTLVTTLISGTYVTLIREYDSSKVYLELDQRHGAHAVNIDQLGSVVPEIRTDENSTSSTIDITIK
jgi:hypothetical protein